MKKPLVFGALLVLLIGGSWLAYSQLKDDKPSQNSSTQQTQNSQSTQQTSSNNSQQNEADKFLVIKEWGVRFAVPADLEGDLSYKLNTKAQETSGGPVLVEISSKGFSGSDIKCSETDDSDSDKPLVSIYREIDGTGGVTTTPAPFKTISNKRYYLAGTTACETAIIAQNSMKYASVVASIKEAIKSLEENN